MSWYYLDPTGLHTGPCNAEDFRGLYEGGYVTAETLVWADGRKDWEALRGVPEVWDTLSTATAGAPAPSQSAPEAAQSGPGSTSASGQLSGDAQQAAAAAGQQPAKRKAAVVAKAAKATPTEAAPEDKELAAFQAEMSALGAVPVPGADLEEPVRAETPDPEDRRFQDDDGTWYIWDALLRKFVEEGAQPVMPDYRPEDMVFEMEEEKVPVYNPPKPGEEDDEEDYGAAAGAEQGEDGAEGEKAERKGKRGKKTDAESVIEKHLEKAKRAREQEDKWLGVQNNLAVYVMGLPDDTSEAELAQFFAKCGILKEDDDGKPRVKLYKDRASGMLKGDGLVYYLKQPSVDLACKILDGGPFRNDPNKVITVQPAKFEMHGDTYVPKKKKAKKKKKIIKEDKVLGWGGFDDLLPPTQVTVILKHVFTPAELEEEPTMKTDLEADMASECNKLGPVDKIRVYQNHPEGVVSIKFKQGEPAQECLKLMKGRFFGGRQLTAELWDGITNYNVKKAQESEEEQAARLARFAAEIEQAQG